MGRRTAEEIVASLPKFAWARPVILTDQYGTTVYGCRVCMAVPGPWVHHDTPEAHTAHVAAEHAALLPPR